MHTRVNKLGDHQLIVTFLSSIALLGMGVPQDGLKIDES